MNDRFVFMADAHIKSRTWTNSMQLTGDAYTALNMLVDKLREYSIDAATKKRQPVTTLVIGGDWFDSNRPSSTDILRTNYFLDQFKWVYYIAGNHDNVTPSYLSVFDCNRTVAIRQLTETPIKLGDQDGAWIAGVSWMSSAEKLQETIQRICDMWRTEHTASDVLYLVLHTSFQHLLSFDGAYKLTQEFINEVTRGMKIRVLVGDIHVRNTGRFTEDENPNDRYIHSPGSLYPLSIDQISQPHAVSLIDALSGEITDVPVKVRSYSILKYSTDEALRALYDRIVSATVNDPLQPFIRVVVPADADVHINTSQFPGAVMQVVRESSDDPDARVVSTSGCTLVQAAVAEAGDNELLGQLVEALLSADDPLQELNDWLEFWNVKQTV